RAGDQAAESPAAPELELIIRLSHERIVLGQLLTVTLELTNTSPLPRQLGGSFQAYVIMISADGEAYHRWRRTDAIYRVLGGKLLQPGETYARPRMVLYQLEPLFGADDPDVQHLAFPRSGQYFLKGRYSKVVSDPVPLRVVEPRGQDAAAWAKLKGTPYAHVVQWWDSGRASESDMAAFREVLAMDPHVVYWEHLALALIRDLQGGPLGPDERQRLDDLTRRYDDGMRRKYAGPEKLTLEVKALDGPILPMEAIRLILTLSNKTKELVHAHGTIDPAWGLLKLYVARDGRRLRHVDVGAVPPMGSRRRPVQFPPGYAKWEQHYLWESKTPEGPTPVFPDPGRYRVKAVLTSLDGKARTESDPITVQVVEATGPDLEAWEFLRQQTPDDRRRYLWGYGGGSRATRLARFRELIDRFPDSRYAAYARYNLGMHHSAAEEFGEAEAALEAAADDARFPFRDRTLYSLFWMANSGGDAEKAESYLSILRADYPDSRWTRLAE
ncbi:MAG: tol-pal system YbgF family protein, partial [Armatimonadota bacterium]